MVRSNSAAILVVPVAAGVSGPATVRAQDASAADNRRPDAARTGATNRVVVIEALGPRFAGSGSKKDATNLKE